jgi:hypothetical protein
MRSKALSRTARVAAIALVAVAATPPHAEPGLLPSVAAPASAALPPSALSVWSGGAWHEWWRSDAAPQRWTAPHNAVADAIEWNTASAASSGARSGSRAPARHAGSARSPVRIDPRLVRLRLDTAFTARGERAAWSVRRGACQRDRGGERRPVHSERSRGAGSYWTDASFLRRAAARCLPPSW